MARKRREWGPDRVLCVSPHKASGGFQIAYVKGGRRKTEQRATEDSANRRAAALQVELAGPHKQVSERPDAGVARSQTKSEWRAMLWDLAQRVNENTEDDGLQRAARVIAQLASADAKQGDEEELTSRISQLEAQTERLLAARDAGPDDAKRQIETRPDREDRAPLQ